MEMLTRDKSGCTKFHPIGNDKRACIDRSGQLPGGRPTETDQTLWEISSRIGPNGILADSKKSGLEPNPRPNLLFRIVTAEVASSSLVVPTILNKDFTLIFMKPERVQKDTNLHPFVSLSLIAAGSLLWFPLCPALRNIGNRCVTPCRGEHQ